MLRVARDLRPKTVVCIGDLADFYSVSAHSKDPNRAGRLSFELDSVRQGLDELDALDATQKILVEGNHEDRLRRYLQDKAPEIASEISLSRLFGLQARGWTYVPYKSDLRLGKLYLTHDVGVAGKYAAYRALEAFQHSVVTGHSHRLCYVVEGNAVGEYKVSAQFGWLGDVKAIDYMSGIKARTSWPLGFGIGYLEPATGIVYLVPVPIVVVGDDYSCCVNGILYRDPAAVSDPNSPKASRRLRHRRTHDVARPPLRGGRARRAPRMPRRVQPGLVAARNPSRQ